MPARLSSSALLAITRRPTLRNLYLKLGERKLAVDETNRSDTSTTL